MNPSAPGAALCPWAWRWAGPCRPSRAGCPTLPASIPRDRHSFSQPQQEWSMLIQMPKGQTCSGTAEAPWHLGGPAPPGQGEEQCEPQASSVPHLGSVTHHLWAEQHRGPLSAATSPLGTPTLGTATGCQRREVPGTGSRTQGLCSPPVTWGAGSPTPGPPQQGMELGTAEEEQPPSWGTACS